MRMSDLDVAKLMNAILRTGWFLAITNLEKREVIICDKEICLDNGSEEKINFMEKGQESHCLAT